MTQKEIDNLKKAAKVERLADNQFIVHMEGKAVLQSYDSIIAIKDWRKGYDINVTLDRNKWDYSKTTGKYRNLFLGETRKETEKKIKEGLYKLAELN
jgi:hypothetical protein